MDFCYCKIGCFFANSILLTCPIFPATDHPKITEPERKKLIQFISVIKVLTLNEQVKNNAIDIRKANQLKIPDSIIAGTSKAFEIPVLSSDKQLKTVKEIQLIFYER